jgi:Domain of unknown function (DU1801)
MPANKTQGTDADVAAFVAGVADEGQQADTRTILAMMGRATGHAPKMWGPSMIGFGIYHYKYESGREGDAFRMGMSPRKGNTVLYIMDGFPKYETIMARLGKYKTGKSCLYIKRLSDIDVSVLEELIAASHAAMQAKYPE